MRLARGRSLTLLLLAVLVICAAGRTSAVPYVVGSGWQDFSTDILTPGLFGGFGGTFDPPPDNEPFVFTVTTNSYLKVTDYYLPGDFYRVWSFGGLLGDTPIVPVDPSQSTFSPGFAYGSPTWSHDVWLLTPAIYSINFQDLLEFDPVTTPFDYEVATAAFRVDPTTAPIPEPGTLALLGMGMAIAGIGLGRRRSK